VPFFTWSSQAGVAHTPEASHTPEAQSLGATQVSPSPQGTHEPPQSIAVSSPFCKWSTQVAATQRCDAQTWDSQSAGPEQPPPFAQGAHGPPQSSPVSSPFFTPSSQAGEAHVPDAQTPETQSLATPQPPPFAHGAQGPPQSTPVSCPFFTWSSQVGSAPDFGERLEHAAAIAASAIAIQTFGFMESPPVAGRSPTNASSAACYGVGRLPAPTTTSGTPHWPRL
jgi:hypothetical protein